MASPSPWRWSWKPNTVYSAVQLSSATSCNPLTFDSPDRRRRRRPFLTTSSLEDSRSSSSSSSSSSSPSSSSSSSSNPSASRRRPMKSIQLPVFSENNIKISTFLNNDATKASTLSWKSFFGRRSLWRRILFASTKVRSIMLLNVLTVVYASNIPVVKEVEAIMDPATFAAVRFGVSAIPFIPFVVRARGDAQTRNAGIELGFWVSLGFLMQSIGLLTSDAGRASFLSMFTVIVVPLLDGMLGAIVPVYTWVGAMMSVLGVAMLESSGSPPSVGDLLNFLSAIFFGVHMLRTEHISRSTSRENFLPLLGYEVCVVALFSTIWYFVGGNWFGFIQECDPSSWTWALFWDWLVAFPWIPALYTGIISTGLCLWIEMDAMRDVSATETAIIYGLEPIWGAGFAWFLLGERWGPLGWIGAALVLGGSLTVQVFGSLSPNTSGDEGRSEAGDHLLAPDKQSGFSTSPVVVKLREDAPDVLK